MKPVLSAAALLIVSSTLLGADQPSNPYETARTQLAAQVAKLKEAAKSDPDRLVLDFVVADRKARTVTLFACATGIGVDEPVEFFVAPANSGKDYESLAITWAKPSDVHKALEFIGMKPGRPVNYDKNYNWARGPRVIMTLDVQGKPVRAEDMIVDSEQHKPLPRSGLLFVGSFVVKDDQGKLHYAADETDSKAIAPDYNDPVAVLDVPRRASQGAVYGFQRPSPDHLMKQGDLVPITLRPATGEQAVADRDVGIKVRMHDGKPSYVLSEDGKTVSTAPTLPHLVTQLAELDKTDDDLFTQVWIDPAMQVEDARKLYAVLMTLEHDQGVKLDPPPPGELFHRAFFPEEDWRRREGRLGEPWELFLERRDGQLIARLERQVENFAPDAEQKTTLQKWPPTTPAEFVKIINDNQSQWTKAIFIYPPEDLTYGELMVWARPALETYPRIFVFPQEPATTQPAPESATAPTAESATAPATQPTPEPAVRP